MIIFVSGNIGAGKSTVVGALAAQCKHKPGWAFIDEPAAEWSSTGLLTAMYDGTLSPGEFQLMALATRVSGLISARADFVVAERSPYEDKHVFAGATLTGIGATNYNFAYDRLMDAIPASEIVHFMLHVRPAVAMARITSRGRPGEQHVTPEYLHTLQEAYATFAPPGTIHHIDANGSEAATLAAIAAVCCTL